MSKANLADNISPRVPVTELFFALIRCGIGKEEQLPATPTEQEWHELFDIAKKQTLAGIAFAGIETLPQEQRPPRNILLSWYKLSQTIRKKNAELNSKSAAVSEKFRREGFPNCILKGQGLAQLYPDPYLRTPGDIDIWLYGDSDKTLAYVRKYFPDCKPTYHHVDFPIAEGLDIEIHYRPSWMCSPSKNKKLQAFFSKNANDESATTINTAEGSFPAPSNTFNRIYILLHIYRHLFFEGIGIRQVLDYHFVTQQKITEGEKAEYIRLLKELGLYKFATAATYAMQRMFSANETTTLVPPNKKEGEFLIREILAAGNFGQHDTRYKATRRGANPTRIRDIVKRSYIMLTHYHSETLWNNYFKVWHWFWRRRHSTRHKNK